MTKAVEVITSVERRRYWSRAEKERIVAAALEPGAVASEVARAAGIHTSQLFRWRQELCRSALVVAQLLFLEADNPKKEIATYIQLAGRRRNGGPRGLRHDAIRPSACVDALHRAGGFDGFAAVGGGPQRPALGASECAHHGASALSATERFG
jgi:transposase